MSKQVQVDRHLRLEILEFLDGLEPPTDGISPVFTLAPTHLDSADYRLGWEACVSEIKGYFLPILGFTREYWAERRKRTSRGILDRRQRRIEIGMCVVATCDERATEGQRCARHAAARRAELVQQGQERRDRVALAIKDRDRLLQHLQRGPGKGEDE